MRYYLFSGLILFFVYSCNNKQSHNSPVLSYTTVDKAKLSSSNLIASPLDCDVSILKERKEYHPSDRLSTLYLLWGISKEDLIEFQKRGEKMGNNLGKFLQKNRKDLATKEMNQLIDDISSVPFKLKDFQLII